MRHNEIPIGGATIFWTLSDNTEYEKLKDGLLDLGLGEFVPPLRTPAACLRDSLAKVYADRKYNLERGILIRPLATKDGFGVVREDRGPKEGGNVYTHLLSATIDATEVITLTPLTDWELLQKIRAGYVHQRSLLRSENVGSCLVKLVDYLNGTRLRQNGGFYWLPEHHLETWVAIAQAIEPSGNPAHSLHIIRNIMDEDAVRAVKDSICKEVEATASRIKGEVETGELQKNALENRRDEAQQLMTKVKLYEGLLSCGLERLREVTEAAETAATLAQLQIITGGEGSAA
jgi:hypothetical protein